MYLRIFDPIQNKWSNTNSDFGKTTLHNYIRYVYQNGGSIRKKPNRQKKKLNWRHRISLKNTFDHLNKSDLDNTRITKDEL